MTKPLDSAANVVYALLRVVTGLMFLFHGVQKIFGVEIDLDLLTELEARPQGFGAVKASRAPLPICQSEISSCYEHRSDELGCRNPEFHEMPLASPSFRVFALLAD